MTVIFEGTFRRYFSSRWIPFAICLGCSVLLILCDEVFHLAILSTALALIAVLSFLGILAASVWGLLRKRFHLAIWNLISLFGASLVFLSIFGLWAFEAMTGPSEDHFADNLSIPENIDISTPEECNEGAPGGKEDLFQKALLDSLNQSGEDEPTVTARVSSLAELNRNYPEILKRFLATSPSWRLFREGKNIFAGRRWMIGNQWQYTLNGYYGRDDIAPPRAPANMEEFGTRLTLCFTDGLNKKPWWGDSKDTTRLKRDQTAELALSEAGQRGFENHCVIDDDDLTLEIYEFSKTKERRLTKATLDYLEAEMSPLLNEPTWETIRKLAPPNAIREGEPSFQLRNSFQPGLYDSSIWINPGEAGAIYLKAYEVTQDVQLSTTRLKESSNEWVGWSDDPSQLFFSNTHFTIYEGDWGKPYAARFEVWFVPDSGAPERKLMEKIFKIEGWQR